MLRTQRRAPSSCFRPLGTSRATMALTCLQRRQSGCWKSPAQEQHECGMQQIACVVCAVSGAHLDVADLLWDGQTRVCRQFGRLRGPSKLTVHDREVQDHREQSFAPVSKPRWAALRLRQACLLHLWRMQSLAHRTVLHTAIA